MKRCKIQEWLIICPMILAIVFLSDDGVFANNQTHSKEKHEMITQELMVMVDQNRELKHLLIKSIDLAKRVNPDAASNPAQSLEEYYDFIDWASKAMPWMLLPKLPWSMLYDRIDQGLAYSIYQRSAA